jgi:hypothetical protein
MTRSAMIGEGGAVLLTIADGFRFGCGLLLVALIALLGLAAALILLAPLIRNGAAAFGVPMPGR